MGQALLKERLAAYDYVIDLIEHEGINCNLERRGRFVGAYAPSHFSTLANKAKELNEQMDLDVRLVSRSDQRDEIGSNFYYGGISIEHAAKIHFALYHKALLQLCRDAGAILSSQTRVIGNNGSKGNFVAKTTKGNIKAEPVIICANGYTGPLTPRLRKRVVPISSQITVTEEFPNDLVMELIPKGRAISESPRATSYYRLTPNNKRVMYGGRARFNNVHPDHSATLLHGMMTERWPQLQGTKITHSWTGFVAMAADPLPHMGEEDGMHFCIGCNGSGVAIMTYMGHMIAQRILHSSQFESAFFGIDFPQIPFHFYAGNPWFLPFLGNYFRLLDRLERR